jgi:hypothetical protein
MTSKPVAFLLADLGVTKTHRRPYTSTDNPYSEAQFKTLKYRRGFPQRFDTIERARTFFGGRLAPALPESTPAAPTRPPCRQQARPKAIAREFQVHQAGHDHALAAARACHALDRTRPRDAEGPGGPRPFRSS